MVRVMAARSAAGVIAVIANTEIVGTRARCTFDLAGAFTTDVPVLLAFVAEYWLAFVFLNGN